jgi:hypothetical protein
MLALMKATGTLELLDELLPEIEKARGGKSGRTFIDRHLEQLGLDLQARGR